VAGPLLESAGKVCNGKAGIQGEPMTTIRSTTPRQGRCAVRLTGLALAALLVACGGGGGSDGDSGTPLVPSAATITAGNLEGVARQTLVAATYLGDATGLVTGAQVAPGAGSLFAFTRTQLERLPGLFGSRTRVVTGVTTSDSFTCTGGGSVSVQTTDNNGNGTVDVGDSGTLTATNCVEDGATFSGTIGLRFTAVSGDLDTDVYTATVAVTLQSLRATTAAGQAAGTGEFTLVIASTDASTGSLDLTVPSLSVAGSFGGVADTVTLQNFRLTSSTALSAGRLRTSSNVSGTVGSTALAGGTVTLATAQPLVQFDTDAHPSSGQIIANGAAGSQMRLTVQSATNVLLELDTSGDGSFESNVVKTWVSLV
jgi:hypothetical protein